VPVHEALLAEIYQVQSAIGQMTGKPETIDLKMRTGDLGLMTWKSPVVDVLSSMRRVPDCCCSHVPGLLRIRHPCL